MNTELEKVDYWSCKINQDLWTILKNQWEKTGNINGFLFMKFIEKYPIFGEKTIQRGSKNLEKYVLEKSLYCRFINKIMSRKSTNTGKKKKAENLVESVLKEKAKKYNIEEPYLLILLLVKSVPNFTIRRIKFGSGTITKAVRLTLLKKISWFLSSFAQFFKTRRPFHELFSEEIDYIMNDSPKSKILALKRECISNAQKANVI